MSFIENLFFKYMDSISPEKRAHLIREALKKAPMTLPDGNNETLVMLIAKRWNEIVKDPFVKELMEQAKNDKLKKPDLMTHKERSEFQTKVQAFLARWTPKDR